MIDDIIIIIIYNIIILNVFWFFGQWAMYVLTNKMFFGFLVDGLSPGFATQIRILDCLLQFLNLVLLGPLKTKKQASSQPPRV